MSKAIYLNVNQSQKNSKLSVGNLSLTLFELKQHKKWMLSMRIDAMKYLAL